MLTIGNALKHHRKMRGLSQGYLGDILEVTFQQVQKYESGINKLSAESLDKILDHWDLSYDQFLCRKEEIDINYAGLDNTEVKQLKYFLKLSVKERQKLIKIHRIMKGKKDE